MAAATDTVRLDLSNKFIKAVYQFNYHSDDVRLQNVKQHLHFIDGTFAVEKVERYC